MNAKTETYKGHEINIEYDEDAQNPRTEWDNLTEIHCNSSRYYLGEHNHSDWEDFNEMLAEAKRQNDFIVKVFAYIHSGTALSLESFHDKLPQGHAEFDSGQCGVVIVRREKMLAEWQQSRWSKKLKQQAYNICKADIEILQAYINGEVFGYVIDDGGESCWGYYSIEDAMTEAKSMVDYTVNEARMKHLSQLKAWIKNKVSLPNRRSMEESIAI